MSQEVKRNTRQLSMSALNRAYAYKDKLLKPSEVFKKFKDEKTQRYAIIVPITEVPDYDEYNEPILDEKGNQSYSLGPVNTAAVIAKAQLSMDFDRVANIVYNNGEYEVMDDYGNSIVDTTELAKYREELKLILQAKMERELQLQAEKDIDADVVVKETNEARIKASYSTKARYEYAKLLFPSAKDDDELNKLIKAKEDFPKKRSFLEEPYAVRLITAALIPLTSNNTIKAGTTTQSINYVYLKINKNLITKIDEAIRKQKDLKVVVNTEKGQVVRRYVSLISQYNLPPDGKVSGLSVANFYENINPFSEIGIPGVGETALIDNTIWSDIIKGLTYEEKTILSKIPEYVADGKHKFSGISTKTAILRIKEFIASNMGIFDNINVKVLDENKYFARLLVNNKDSEDFVRIANSDLIATAEKLLDSQDGKEQKSEGNVSAPLTKEDIQHMEEVTRNPVEQYEDTSLIDFS